MAEIAGGAALLVDPLSTDAIADGLRRLADGGAFVADLVARGCERVRAFTWERTAEVTEAVYRRVAAGRMS
jgi:alpha-1,3-rhamnosyl/mannosyltransferase